MSKHSQGRAMPLVPGEWLGPESNRRHEDFQSSALPTELPSHVSESILWKTRLWSRSLRQDVEKTGLQNFVPRQIGALLCPPLSARQGILEIPFFFSGRHGNAGALVG